MRKPPPSLPLPLSEETVSVAVPLIVLPVALASSDIPEEARPLLYCARTRSKTAVTDAEPTGCTKIPFPPIAFANKFVVTERGASECRPRRHIGGAAVACRHRNVTPVFKELLISVTFSLIWLFW